VILFITVTCFSGLTACKTNSSKKESTVLMKEKQISFSAKNHALDNNDNFSPDDKFLCYDTRGTVFNDNIGNCKTIEKIEISTGLETVLYEPESVTGEQAAPGVGAVSWHPSENKVVFIHGPLTGELEKRGYYGITNRTGVEVSADGNAVVTKVDMRDISIERPTIPGVHRGGTHRHEYSRNGNRIGFTYDDFLLTSYDRTIGYMETIDRSPEGYTHFFAVLLKPAEKGKSKPGEIEKAYGDSWVGAAGSMRAFIGKVRAENGVDYNYDLFVADIPDNVDITTAFSGTATEYPEPPQGIKIRRLTQSGTVSGIVRGSSDGKTIAYLDKNEAGIYQVFVIASNVSALSADPQMNPRQLSNFSSDVSCIRWHPSGNWVFGIVNGNIVVMDAVPGENFGKTIMLTSDSEVRNDLVVSTDGNLLACTKEKTAENDKIFKQIFVSELNWDRIKSDIKN
jgi:hypothetical protein